MKLAFLEQCNVFKPFVRNFARLAAPLNYKFRKYQPKHFDMLVENESAAGASLKEDLTSPHSWLYREEKASTHSILTLVISKSGAYYFRSRKMEGTVLLANYLALWMTKSKY